MIFWALLVAMVLLALAFVVVPVLKPEIGRKPLLIGGVVVLIPLIAVALYQKIGTPTVATSAPMPNMPPMQGAMPPGHPDNPMMKMDLGQLADKLAEKLKNQPDNADGWALLARTYVEVKRHKDSIPAFEHAISLLPKDARLLADYADALAVANGGVFDQKSHQLIDQALAIDPVNVKALMLKATVDFNAKNYGQAITSWKKILTVPGLDAETTKEAQGSIQEATRLMAAGSK